MSLTPCVRCAAPMKRGTACPSCGQSARTRGKAVPFAAAALLLGLVGCEGDGGGAVALYGVPITDEDGDGYDTAIDCNDDDPSIHPDAAETAGDGVDSNCDGQDDPAT
jgi:hypothetical protein